MISFIVAVSKNNVIGRKNKLPWRQKTDYEFYKNKAAGHIAVMGRKTFELVGRSITDKQIIVLARDESYHPDGVAVVHDIKLALPETDEEVMVLGGGEIYRQALPYTDRMYITEIDVVIPDGDTFFPEFDHSEWRETSREHHTADDRNQYDYDFVIYDRIKN
jgi:dihydrofolate reductase